MRLGYACIPLTINAKTHRRILLKDYNEKSLINIIEENLRDLKIILIHNNKNDINLFRISSDIIPLASHEINTYNWQEGFKPQLREIGEYIKTNNMRVSMHPGQYTIINSPNEDIVKKSMLDLKFHCDFLDELQIDYTNKIILHVGGVYGDKIEAKKRFINNFYKLSDSIKKRLVIENDEKNFSLDDVLEIANTINIPVIFDNLHNICYGDNDYSLYDIYSKVKETWKAEDGPIKVHYSQQDSDRKKGSHSKTIYVKEFIDYYNQVKAFNPDIMLEVKDKDISTIKCNNVLKEMSNSTLTPEYIDEEWKRYELLVMEHGTNSVKICESINETFHSIIPLYESIDTALKSPLDEGGYKLALEKCFKITTNLMTNREINHLKTLIDKNELEKGKAYIDKISKKYNVDDLLSTYYLSQ